MAKKQSQLSEVFSARTMINKYVIATLAFAIWMLFFDKYKVSSSIYLSKTVNKLELSKVEYEEMLAEAIIERRQLEENSEKYAREKFYMHKPGEEVFIIEK